jgi:long-chain acyl-CoA synthetase
MITKDFIIQKMRKQVDVTNRYLAQFEMIKEFALIPHEWSIDGGELTPKLSLRRKEIMRINEQLIHKIYSSETRV